ncbi:MAG: sigma-70 family RNA polymerase sigma factor [Deltaproteobacteria bacterium]|nr:MAG: sigma-70 family RNA polymerase sigma factor [Deltaproteobacteria bacterium]
MEERELIRKVQKGEKEAFKDLIAPYQRKIYSLLYGMVGNREDALELTQEALIKAYRSIRSFRMASSFYTWLYRIAVNLALDFRRQRTVNPEANEAIGPQQKGRPDSSLLRKELNEQIRRAIAKLPSQHRAIILLREVEGLSYREISEVMGCQLGTVMSRLHYAREGLRGALASYLRGEE